MTDVINLFNVYAWVTGNVLLAYIAFLLVVFVIGYFVLYDPRATTGGRLIFRFMLSLVGLTLLIFVGTFIDPAGDRNWLYYPEDVASWRPGVRLAIYTYIAYATTSLAALLAIRKWFPHKVRKASDLNLVRLRHTGPIRNIDNER